MLIHVILSLRLFILYRVHLLGVSRLAFAFSRLIPYLRGRGMEVRPEVNGGVRVQVGGGQGRGLVEVARGVLEGGVGEVKAT